MTGNQIIDLHSALLSQLRFCPCSDYHITYRRLVLQQHTSVAGNTSRTWPDSSMHCNVTPMACQFATWPALSVASIVGVPAHAATNISIDVFQTASTMYWQVKGLDGFQHVVRVRCDVSITVYCFSSTSSLSMVAREVRDSAVVPKHRTWSQHL